MISLLPPDDKAEIRAGRVNRLLARYLVLFVVLMVVLFAELGVAYYVLHSTKAKDDASIASSQASSAQLVKQKQEVTQFSSDLATAKQILDKQINYSTILLRIAAIMPSGTVLEQITIDPSTVNKPTTMVVGATSEASAIALKVSMTSSPYFSDTHFTTLTLAPSDTTGHPYTANITTTFTPEMLK